MARNTNQVFGENLNTPVDFVLFYANETPGSIRPQGGTGQAVEMARRKGIPTINMQDADWRTQLDRVLSGKPAQISNTSKVIEGDMFALPGIPVITTNLGGIHGAGLAQLAKSKGLIQQGNGSFKATDKVVQLPVKKVWSDSMAMNDNMNLLKESLRSLIKVARENPSKTYLLPLAGLGHGEGKVSEIMPLLILTLEASPNIKLVLPAPGVSLGRQGTVRKDETREKLPEIKAMLEKAGLMGAQQSTTAEQKPLGNIKLNIIEDWVQSGQATTTVRNSSYHNSFYKGDGVYTTDKGNLVNITHRGLVKLQGDRIVGNNISYTKDEFAKAEGFGTWANFEKGAKYAGKTLMDGGSVHLYDITPATSSEVDNILKQKEQESKNCNG